MKILWNPFEKFTETQLLLFAMLVTVPGLFLAQFCNARFDGALDLHFSENVTLTQLLIDLAVNTFSLFTFITVAAIIVNRRTRPVDILATAVVARIPSYIMPVFNCTGYVSRSGKEMAEKTLAGDTSGLLPDMPGLLIIIAFALLSVLTVVWMIALLYNGYRVAANAKGLRSVLWFIVAILAAETASKIVLAYLNPTII